MAIKIEVCAYSLASCITAEQAGANRIELCGGRLEGGTTPSAGLIKAVLASVNIPVVVMIRPRGGDFCYSDSEIKIMQTDLEICKDLGVKEVIFGILKPDGSINKTQMQTLIEAAKPMQCSIHRAFDMVANMEAALEEVISLGCVRILTSGRQTKVIDGLKNLENLVFLAKNRIEIMAGSGVNASNAQALINTGVDALHLSASGVFESAMQYKNPDVSMASSTATSEYELSETVFEKVAEVMNILG
jgi:copper homeostasis protein